MPMTSSNTSHWLASFRRSLVASRLGWLALLLFAISFSLPSYGSEVDASPARGWTCFWFCIQVLDRNFLQAPGQLYYFGFAVTNLLFCVLCVRQLRGLRRTWLTRLTSVLLFCHVLSWLVLNLPPFANEDPSMIRFGYFVWLAAFGLLVAGEFKSRLDRTA